MPSARSAWMRCRRPIPAIPACRWAAADIASVLFTRFLKFDAAEPHWPDRDRFVLSAGHGSMLLYSLLYLLGYEDMRIEDLKQFPPARLARPPAIPNMAMPRASRRPPARSARASPMRSAWRSPSAISMPASADDLVDHRTYVLAGDGCLMEGISQEAIALAGHLKLNQLIVLFDDNGISIDGKVSLADSTDQLGALRCLGLGGGARRRPRCRTRSPPRSPRPSTPTGPRMIACRTIIGFGAPNKQGTAATHGSPLGAEEIAGARARRSAGRIRRSKCPTSILEAWREAGRARQPIAQAWKKRLDEPNAQRESSTRAMLGRLPGAPSPMRSTITRRRSPQSRRRSPPATPRRTRSTSSMSRCPKRSAARPTSPAPTTPSRRIMKPLTAADYGGRYIHYGIREHAHGRRHERHGAAWRHHSLWRHLPVLHRLLPPVDPARRAHGHPRDLCDDP